MHLNGLNAYLPSFIYLILFDFFTPRTVYNIKTKCFTMKNSRLGIKHNFYNIMVDSETPSTYKEGLWRRGFDFYTSRRFDSTIDEILHT